MTKEILEEPVAQSAPLKKKDREYFAKISGIRLTPEQDDLARRRVQPFADAFGIQTYSLTHLMQESYLQGMADATEAMVAERDKLKAENDWLHRQLAGFTSNA